MTPALSLTTRGDGPAVDGPQATLTWRPAPAWSLGLGAAWESERYRLADDGPVLAWRCTCGHEGILGRHGSAAAPSHSPDQPHVAA